MSSSLDPKPEHPQKERADDLLQRLEYEQSVNRRLRAQIKEIGRVVNFVDERGGTISQVRHIFKINWQGHRTTFDDF